MKILPQTIKPDNMINRKYQKLRNIRNKGIALSSINFSFAAGDALVHNGFATVIMGGLTLFSLKMVEVAINSMLKIKPEYKQYLERAKNINKMRKHNKKFNN